MTIPELGTRRAAVPPVAILTSNRTRDLHDALKRRCLYHWIRYPDADRVAESSAAGCRASTSSLADQIAAAVERLRDLDLYKAPGVAEAISWARRWRRSGVSTWTPTAAERTLGAVLKYDEDLPRVGTRAWPR